MPCVFPNIPEPANGSSNALNFLFFFRN